MISPTSFSIYHSFESPCIWDNTHKTVSEEQGICHSDGQCWNSGSLPQCRSSTYAACSCAEPSGSRLCGPQPASRTASPRALLVIQEYVGRTGRNQRCRHLDACCQAGAASDTCRLEGRGTAAPLSTNCFPKSSLWRKFFVTNFTVLGLW